MGLPAHQRRVPIRGRVADVRTVDESLNLTVENPEIHAFTTDPCALIDGNPFVSDTPKYCRIRLEREFVDLGSHTNLERLAVPGNQSGTLPLESVLLEDQAQQDIPHGVTSGRRQDSLLLQKLQVGLGGYVGEESSADELGQDVGFGGRRLTDGVEAEKLPGIVKAADTGHTEQAFVPTGILRGG